MKRADKREKGKVSAGFTYVEVLVCLLIMTSIIGPICISFMTSNKVRATAESLEESTMYTEALLERIKQQLTQDIRLKKQKENGEILEYPLEDEAKKSIELCLDEAYVDTVPLDTCLLSDFLWEQDFQSLDQEVIAKHYGSKRYAYEVAIWRMENINIAEGILIFNDETLERAAKFYTHPAYCFKDYEASSKKMHLKIDKALSMKFWKPQYVPREIEDLKIIDEYTIILSKTNLESISGKLSHLADIRGISHSGKLIMDEPRLVKNNKGLIGIIYTSKVAEAYKPDEMTIINVDIRQLLGYKNSELLKSYQKLTLTFVNETQRNQVIRVIEGNQNEQGLEGDSLKNNNEKIEIVAVDKGMYSKTSVQYIGNKGFEENFIIAIVTRDMKPVIGKAGKVVKQMIDVYSYK